MKLVVASARPTLEARVGSQLHRSAYLMIIDSDTMGYAVITNPLVSLSGPAAGRLFARQLAEEGIKVVLAGNCSGSVMDCLTAEGMLVMLGIAGSVEGAVKRLTRLCAEETLAVSFKAPLDKTA